MFFFFNDLWFLGAASDWLKNQDNKYNGTGSA